MEKNPSYPFKFLDPYTSEDYDLFFGRKAEVSELYDKVFRSNLMLVYGKSGTGKTSLVQCGLSGRLRDTDWLPLFIRRADDFNVSLLQTITNNAKTPIPKDLTTYERVESLYLDHFKPIFFVFDQFEELFILGKRMEQMRFVRNVASIIDTKLPVKVIIVMREEYLAELYDFERIIPQIMDNRLRVELMGRNNAREVIVNSCGKADPPIQLAPQVEDQIIDIVSQEKGRIELTYLQVFLDKLYRLSSPDIDGTRAFSDGLIRSAGNIGDILKDFVDQQIELFAKDHDDKALPVNFLRLFATSQGTKIPLHIEDVDQKLEVSHDKVLLCFEFFERRRILRPLENNLYELLHDSIALHISTKRVMAYELPNLPTGTQEGISPIVGYRPYGLEHEDWILGRDREIAGLFNDIMNEQLSRITVVHGKLGVGKTSIILAGVIPRLKAYREVEYVRFTRELIQNEVLPFFRNSDEYLESSLYTSVSGKSTIIVWDQLEELFIGFSNKEIKLIFDFISTIYRTLSTSQFVWVVREEFFAVLIDLEEMIPDLMTKRRKISRFTDAQCRTVLGKINESFNLPFDRSNTIDDFISGLKSEDGTIMPAYLQLYIKKILDQTQE